MSENDTTNGKGKKAKRFEVTLKPGYGRPEGEQDKDFIISTCQSNKYASYKYEVFVPVPNVDKLIEEGASLKDLNELLIQMRGENWALQNVLNDAARQMSYKPPYPAKAWNMDAEPTITKVEGDQPDRVDYPEKENCAQLIQKAMDEFRPGEARKSVAAETKKKASAFDELLQDAREMGYTGGDSPAEIAKWYRSLKG